MSQHKTILNLWLFLFSLTLFLSLTGCATISVYQFILHPQSEFGDEFMPTNNELAGTYSGLETINGHSYASIMVLPYSNDCKERPVIELLLPMEKNSDAKSTLRFGKSTKEQLPGGDKYAGQPVRIVFYSSSNDNEINIDKSMTLMLSGHNWRGYPSVVIVGYKKGGLYINRLAYRIAPENNDFLVRPFDCNELCHSAWTCKNKENNVAGIILIPFAVVFDTITAPVQLLLTVVNLCIHGGL
jgi:uncharacterized protein YceK